MYEKLIFLQMKYNKKHYMWIYASQICSFHMFSAKLRVHDYIILNFKCRYSNIVFITIPCRYSFFYILQICMS